MSIESLLKELQSATAEAIVEIRKRIIEEFSAARTDEDRAHVLAIYKDTMDRVERGLEARGGHEEVLAKFKEARAYDYKSLIAQECLVAGDSPGGGDISVEKLMAVTDREIAAGRMTEDHPMRKIAVQCAAAPHASTPKVPPQPGNATTAYAFGSVLGKKLKGLFRK